MPDAPVLLTPEVAVIVHEIDTSAHPTYQPGTWRWAVMVGGRPPHDLEHCANAGGELSMAAALEAADPVAAGIVVALRIFGIPVAPPKTIILDHDPIAPGADRIRRVWRK